MLDGLRKCIDRSVVVDYKTNSGKVVYAKGILKEIMPEPLMLVVEGKDGTMWYILYSSIESMKVDGEGNEP